jgi:hypothetical protein
MNATEILREVVDTERFDRGHEALA